MLDEVTQLGQDAVKVAAVPLWPLADNEVTACLTAAYRLQQAAVALQVQLVQHVESRGIVAAQGCRSTAAWLRSWLLIDSGPARELAERAGLLARQPAVQHALADGLVDAHQASAIADTVEAAAASLTELDLADAGPAAADEIVHRATTTLIEMAGQLPAFQLRQAGERILAHVAPHLADQADELALARQEARAHQARGFTLSQPVDGQVRLSGRLGLEDAAVLQAALHPLCAPGSAPAGDRPVASNGDRPVGSDGDRGVAPDDDRRPAQRRADALIEVCRLALRTGELPASGGEPAQLAVTVAFDPLTQSLGPGTSETGLRLSAETVRRLACDARILPAVLGSAGQVLDLGRTQRLATAGLRRALHLRDGGCAFPNCDRPARWTDAHHMIPWTAGGVTCLDNLVLLCRRHHRLIHHPTAGWQVRLGADQHPEFIPPPSIDPDQVPRRNLYRQPGPHIRR